MDSAPATSPATPDRTIVCSSAVPPPTPNIKAAIDTRPSLAPAEHNDEIFDLAVGVKHAFKAAFLNAAYCGSFLMRLISTQKHCECAAQHYLAPRLAAKGRGGCDDGAGKVVQYPYLMHFLWRTPPSEPNITRVYRPERGACKKTVLSIVLRVTTSDRGISADRKSFNIASHMVYRQASSRGEKQLPCVGFPV